MKKAIIFDLDGTLWDSASQIVEAWNDVFNRHPDIKKQITLSDMKALMGKTLPEIGEILFPFLEKNKRELLMEECCSEETIYLEKHVGVLYPNVKETLERLKENYHLSIVSNCQDGYVQQFLRLYNFESYFSDFEMSGRTKMPKGHNIKLIINRNNIDKAIYLGDTQGDNDACTVALIPFVFASYGFGDTKSPYTIKTFSEIESIAQKLL